MSNKIAEYLREHVSGEVSSDSRTLDFFSTDGSVLTVAPRLAVYPKNAQDVRKVLRFCWRLAEKGTILPITARGSGTDQAGGALGDGIILTLPAHINKLLSLDAKTGLVTVQPGINYRSLQTTLNSHGLFLPPYPSSIDYSTIGGAVANNASGVRTVKYGDTRQMTKALDVVLSNGDTIYTTRLSKKELAKKKSLHTFEGEIYRQVDDLIHEVGDFLEQSELGTTKNSSGYALSQVVGKDGSFDLTPLIVGSQGTLGVVTAAQLQASLHNTNSSMIMVGLTRLEDLSELNLNTLSLTPSALEIVDKNLLNQVHKLQPNQLNGLLEEPYPNFILIVEFDDQKEKDQAKKVKRFKAFAEDVEATILAETNDPDDREKIWQVRNSAAIIMGEVHSGKAAVPIIEDGCVPPGNFTKLISGTYSLFSKYNLDVAVWGHAGDANIHLQPMLNLSILGDRQKAFKIMDAYYGLVLDLGGTISGEHNDGRLRAPYMKTMYPASIYEAFARVKQIFDPYNILNPGVKFGTTKEDLVLMMRHEFESAHWRKRLPMS
ncbi:MAG TPA: FAD-binding oxidoreductase, partial [Candidatus Saccharimonadales bacterium]|nr:FAD-binding oxidoreductase [Candidatus Saccharimonadales bacterium]